MPSNWEKAKTVADIAKLAADIWGIWRDKNKTEEERGRRIKELEKEISDLKEQIKEKAKS